MDGLDDLFVFQQIVEHGGLTAAARALGRPKSTLTRRLQMLEKRLGNPLFHRGSRRLSLTAFGRACYQQSMRVSREAEKMFRMAERMSAAPRGALHVAWPAVLGQLVLESIAMDYLSSNPAVTLHVTESNAILNPHSIGADFVLHASFTPLSNLDVVARKIYSAPYLLVAHPVLFEDFALPTIPQDLELLPGLGFGPKALHWRWHLQNDAGRIEVPFKARVTTPELSVLVSATQRGLGVAALPRALCQADLSAQRLHHVLPGWHPRSVHVYALYANGRTLTRAAREFLAQIEGELAARLGGPGEDDWVGVVVQ